MEVEMKATVMRLTVMFAVVMMLSVASAYGQDVKKYQSFVVPFEFNVGDKVLPAGEYKVTGETQIIRIQSKDGNQNATVLPLRTVGTARTNYEAKLTFKGYNDQYYLSQVWLADGIGRELKRKRQPQWDQVSSVGTVDIMVSR
jgi:hypothetical protein